ncbi:MAG: PAS domain S-box protein [Candidatus Natronoplasma sp.]
MEGELGDSERSLSSLIENVPGIVYRCELDRDWTMRYLSEGCSEITGYVPSEFIDNKKLAWAEIINPEDRERVWRVITESLEEDEQFHVNYRIITKEGEERWVWEQGKAIRNEEDEIEDLEGFITDITKEMEDQKRLKEREKKTKELYKATTKLARCNTKREVYELAIGSAEKILGFYTCVLFIEDDGSLEAKQSTDQSSFEEGDLLSLEEENLMALSYKNDETYLARDIPNEKGVGATQHGLKSGINVPIRDKGLFVAASKEKNHFDEFDLEMAKILASHINETLDRIESQKEKSLILETTEELIVFYDTNFTIKWGNRAAAETAGLKQENLQGKKCYEIWGDCEDTCEGCPVAKAVETGKKQEGSREYKGTHWLIKATPIKNEKDEVIGVVDIALDITEREKNKQRLKENKEKIEGLLKATSRLEKQDNLEDIYKVAIDAIENIIKIGLGAIFVLEDDQFVLKEETSGVPNHDIKARESDDGMLGKTFRTKEPDITDDLQSSEDAELHFEEYRSGISVPIGDFGVFQAMSKEKGHFDEEDLNMLELLSSHVSEARKRVKLLHELQKSEKRYRSLFEDSPISIWEEDFSEVKSHLEDLKDSGVEDVEEYFTENPEEVKRLIRLVDIEAVNKTTLEVFRAESKEELVKNFDKVLRDESQEGVISELVAIANDEHTFESSEFVNYTLDGKKRYFYMKWTTVQEKDSYYKVIVSLVDITKLKDTQKELERSEKKYRSIFESTGTAMAMIDKDKTISLVNEEFIKLTGFSKEEIEEEAKWPKFIAEKDRKRMESYHQKRREYPERVPSSYEFTAINRFGDARDVVIELGLIPETEKTVASIMDITDFKKTFVALRESQEAFRLLFDNVDDPVVLIDEDQEIKEVNNSFLDMLEYDEEEIIGKSYEETVRGKMATEVGENLKKVFSGELDEFENDVIFETGKEDELPMKLQCKVVKDHKETPLYVIGILRPG